MRWVVGTNRGLFGSDGEAWLVDRDITSLAWDGGGWLVLAHGDEVDLLGEVPEETGRCVLPVAGGALVGTANARLVFVRDGDATMLERFDGADGRDGWYTPWGGPPDTRSLSRSADGSLFANVHVGGILRAADPDGT